MPFKIPVSRLFPSPNVWTPAMTASLPLLEAHPVAEGIGGGFAQALDLRPEAGVKRGLGTWRNHRCSSLSTSGLRSPASSLKSAALAEYAAQHAGHGEDELAVGNGLAEGLGDPVSGAADAALMAGGADVATLAGEGEEALVTAVGVGIDEAGESGGEVTT